MYFTPPPTHTDNSPFRGSTEETAPKWLVGVLNYAANYYKQASMLELGNLFLLKTPPKGKVSAMCPQCREHVLGGDFPACRGCGAKSSQ